MKILIVEDSEAVADMVCRLLEQKGHSLRVARTCAEALDTAFAETPDVMIVDMHLSDGDGIDVAKKVRRLAGKRRVRVIGLSGDPVDPSRQRALDAFLLKPVALRELISAVEKKT